LAKGHISIVVAQHLLLYTSGYVVASTAYLIHNGTFTKNLLPIAVILEFSVCLNVWFVLVLLDNGLTFAGLCITYLHRPLQPNSMAVISTRWTKLLDFPSMLGSAI
jgi:hypothetical protein